MTEKERQAMVAVCDAIQGIYNAFGLPGHYGDSTPAGKALYALYSAEASILLRLLIDEQKREETSHDEH